MATPQLRPLTVGEIVDTAIKVVTGNARVLFTIAAMILIPVGVIQILVYLAFQSGDLFTVFDSLTQGGEVLTPAEAEAAVASLLQLFAVTLAVASLAWVGSLLVEGASVKAAADVYQGGEPSWQDSLRLGLRRLVTILVATIAVGVGSTIGLFFFLLPGVWLFTSWAVTIPAVVVEGKGPFAAMRRSYQLVRPKFGATLGVVVLAFILYLVLSYVVGALSSVFTFLDPLGAGSLAVSVVGSTLASIVVIPFIAAVLIVLYFDLRVRAEGYDLELMARELGETQSPLPSNESDDPFGLGRPGS